jgi:hypothetical protein
LSLRIIVSKLLGREEQKMLGTRIIALCAVMFVVACGGDDDGSDQIVVATPFAISIETVRFTEPSDLAAAHCQKFGRKAVTRGGIPVGDPSWKTLWGYDCVDP